MLRSFSAALILVCVLPLLAMAEGGVYELRIYTCEPGKLDALNARFKDHTMRIFQKHGMKNVAYWTPLTPEADAPKLVYIIQHESRDAAKASWKAFIGDPEWKAVAKASRDEHGKILAKAPESKFLALTDYSPKVGKLDQKKVYELRTYTTHAGKLDDLHARFRDHTMKIFERHGLHNFAYWTPTDGAESKNVLTYVLEYDSKEQAQASWKKFAADPDWKKARAESEKDGKILSKRPESLYMVPTAYSPTEK